MDPDCKRRISRSLGSLDDILVTLERLKQGPGFSHADQEVKVAKEPDATCSPRGQEGQEESREPEVSAERSKSREEEEEEEGAEEEVEVTPLKNNPLFPQVRPRPCIMCSFVRSREWR